MADCLAESFSGLPLAKSCLAQSQTLFPGVPTSKDWEMSKYSFALPDFRRGELNGALWHLPGSGEGETREAPREQNLRRPHSQVHTNPEFQRFMVMNLKRCQSARLCIFSGHVQAQSRLRVVFK